MASTFTANKSHLEKPAAGDYVDAWAPPVNANWDVIDAGIGGNLSVTINTANVTLSTAQAQNAVFNLSGTLTGNRSLIFPAVGGIYCIFNACAGSFTVTAITSAGGSTGVVIPVNGRSIVQSDGTNIRFADDNTVARFNSNAGNPNGAVNGVAATAFNPASVIWDRTNNVLYVCTTTGSVWTAINITQPTPQGILTLQSANPVISGDVTTSSIFYTPYMGNLIPIPNGSSFQTFTFPELGLSLSASQAANNIYDIYVFLQAGTTPTLGLSPSWAAGTGGSVAAGSCARGTGAGGTQLSRLGSLLVNTVSMTLLNGASSFPINPFSATYVGSVFIDSVAGQTTCHRGYGQSRKWGLWNCYNRVPTYLKGGDGNASWTYASNTIRSSNGNAANSLTVFSGLTEEVYSTYMHQKVNAGNNAANIQIGVGWNTTSSFNGTVGVKDTALAGTANNMPITVEGGFLQVPTIGISVVSSLEASTAGVTATYFGTESFHVLSAHWRA